MSATPLYTSKGTFKSLWQEYRVYADRLEFGTMFGQMKIPFESIESIDVSESDLKGLFKGDLKLKNFRPALKLDWANLAEHVVVDKSDGFVHRVLITPEDPRGFKDAVDAAMSKYLETAKS